MLTCVVQYATTHVNRMYDSSIPTTEWTEQSTPLHSQVLGFPSNQAATLATIGVGANKLLFSIVTFLSIDKIGRRPLLLIGISLLSVSMMLLGCLSVIFVDPHLIMSNNISTLLSNCNNTISSSHTEYVMPVT